VDDVEDSALVRCGAWRLISSPSYCAYRRRDRPMKMKEDRDLTELYMRTVASTSQVYR
jgi:hypothetical protein